MIYIERMRNYSKLALWLHAPVEIETLKARLSEATGLDMERRRQLHSTDADFNAMCTRIAQCHFTAKSLQVNALNVSYDGDQDGQNFQPKNGFGLANARQPWKRGKGKGKGGKGFKGGKGGRAKGGKGKGRTGQPGFMSRQCSLHECSDAPFHTIGDCPETKFYERRKDFREQRDPPNRFAKRQKWTGRGTSRGRSWESGKGKDQDRGQKSQDRRPFRTDLRKNQNSRGGDWRKEIQAIKDLVQQRMGGAIAPMANPPMPVQTSQ
jgi:hypothetical protein